MKISLSSNNIQIPKKNIALQKDKSKIEKYPQQSQLYESFSFEHWTILIIKKIIPAMNMVI